MVEMTRLSWEDAQQEEVVEEMEIVQLEMFMEYTRVSIGVLNFRASLYRDQFQFFGPC